MARPRPLASRALAALLLGCFVAALLPALSAPAQESGTATLAPLSGRFPARGTTPDTAMTMVSVEQADDGSDPIVVVSFAAGFTLPGDGYRVAISLGDPGAQRVRGSLLVEDGSAVGVIERGDGTSWESLGNTRASFDATAGQARVEFPAELVTDRAAIWVEIEVGAAIAAATPIFSWSDLRGPTNPARLGVSAFGLVTDAELTPTGDIVQVDLGPELEYVNGNIMVSFRAPPPTDVRGNPAASVIDYIRVGSEPATGGLPPYYVTIDHARRQVVLWDGSTGLPTPVPSDPATWVVQGFPEPDSGAAPELASEIVISLDGLSQAIGLTVDDATLGLGLARSVALVDGRLVTFDGVTGLAAWFEGSAAATLPPVEEDIAELPTPTTVPPAGESSDSSAVPWIVLGIVAAAVVVALVVWALRRKGDDTDDFTRIGTATTDGSGVPADAAPDDQSTPDGVRLATPRAAGVSPDEALAALQRTVEEVTSKLDATTAERPKVKVPDGGAPTVDGRAGRSPRPPAPPKRPSPPTGS